jgi:hypothetical protein
LDIPPPPSENLQIYSYLYTIETALRELIVETFEKLDGPRWYKKRLPNDVAEKFADAVNRERRIRWTQVIPHHPIYYVDFAHLQKILRRSDNWRDAGQHLFRNESILSGTLTELEEIRNKIAHNRRASPTDLELVRSGYLKLAQSLGEARMHVLSSKCTIAPDIHDRLLGLHKEALESLTTCLAVKPATPLPTWRSISRQWWFDDTYLGTDLSSIWNYFTLAAQYASLPRTRGSGPVLERWIAESGIEDSHSRALATFSQLLSQ